MKHKTEAKVSPSREVMKALRKDGPLSKEEIVERVSDTGVVSEGAAKSAVEDLEVRGEVYGVGEPKTYRRTEA